MKTRLIAAAVAACSLFGVASAQAGTVYYWYTGGRVVMPWGNGVTPVLSVTIPKGNWGITAKASPVFTGGMEIIRCGIYVAGSLVDQSAVQVGSMNGGPLVGTLSSQWVGSFSQPTVVTLGCTHDDYNYSGMYIDPGASMIFTAF
jgi:hypothetical protein